MDAAVNAICVLAFAIAVAWSSATEGVGVPFGPQAERAAMASRDRSTNMERFIGFTSLGIFNL
jgi:hypothetical protein